MLRFITLFTICFILLQLFSFNVYSQQSKAKVITNMAHVYEQPNTDSPRLRTLTKNVIVTILKSQPGWHYIEVHGKYGWIEQSKVFIIKSAEKTDDTQQPAVEEQYYEEEEEESVPLYTFPDRVFYFGLRLGINIASITGNDVSDTYKSRIGWSAGGFANIKFGKVFSIQPELLYSQKGAKVEAETSTSTWKYDYVELPLLFKFNIPIDTMISPYITAGPYIAYKIQAIRDTDGKIEKFTDIKPLDYGLSLGAGLSYYINERYIFIDCRYGLGLTTFHDTDTDTKDMKNNVIFISLGITL